MKFLEATTFGVEAVFSEFRGSFGTDYRQPVNPCLDPPHLCFIKKNVYTKYETLINASANEMLCSETIIDISADKICVLQTIINVNANEICCSKTIINIRPD